MNIIKYRKYVVNFKYISNHIKNKSLKPWEQLRLAVPTYNRRGPLWPWANLSHQNHPLVNKGEAYWSNSTHLCLGYRLRNNHDIFRPIFRRSRQNIINQFQNDINRIVIKRKEKRAFIELLKIKRLPIELVEKIIKLTY